MTDLFEKSSLCKTSALIYKFDNNRYSQKLPHIYVMTKWMANNHFFVTKSKSENKNHKIKIIKYKSRFYDKKVVIYHPLCHNINMLKLLVILVVIKLYARIDILNINFWILWLSFLISFKMINFRSNFMQLFLASFMKISSFNSFKYFCHRLISVLI